MAIGAVLQGVKALWQHLNLAFLLPLAAGILASLIQRGAPRHLADGGAAAAAQCLLLRSGGVFRCWSWRSALPASGSGIWCGWCWGWYWPVSCPAFCQRGTDAPWVIVAGGAIAISAMLLPGVSGSFLLLTMGLYGTVMTGIKSFDLTLILLFGSGCAIGLFTFSRVLSWLFRHHHTATLMLLVGFILGSLPVLWPWRTITDYRLGPKGEQVPLDYQFMMPETYTSVTGEPAQLWAALALMLAGILLVWFAGERSGPDDSSSDSRKEQEHA